MSAAWQASFAKYPALGFVRRGDWSGMSAAMVQSSVVEQTRAAQTTDHLRRRGEFRRCSPDARLLPELSAALERAREIPVEPCGVPGSFWYSNCGRRIQKDRDPSRPAQSYDDQLKAITIEQAIAEHGAQAELELKRLEHEYNVAVDVAEYGGSPIATVIVYSPSDGVGHEYPVAQGWTRDRVVRRVTRTEQFYGCLFCDHGGRMDTFVKVDCGAVRRVLPICSRCEDRWRVGDYADVYYDLDFERAWDDWHQATGWPDDRFL